MRTKSAKETNQADEHEQPADAQHHRPGRPEEAAGLVVVLRFERIGFHPLNMTGISFGLNSKNLAVS